MHTRTGSSRTAVAVGSCLLAALALAVTVTRLDPSPAGASTVALQLMLGSSPALTQRSGHGRPGEGVTVASGAAADPTRTVATAHRVLRPATGTSPSAFVAQVVTLTNQQRAAGGCQPLTVNTTLTTVAQAHGQDMADHNYFDHDSQHGQSPFDRMTAAGYRFSSAAENIAAGQSAPRDVMQAWMNSPGHRANILNCALRQIGVGHATGGSYGSYWVQDFGTPM